MEPAITILHQIKQKCVVVHLFEHSSWILSTWWCICLVEMFFFLLLFFDIQFKSSPNPPKHLSDPQGVLNPTGRTTIFYVKDRACKDQTPSDYSSVVVLWTAFTKIEKCSTFFYFFTCLFTYQHLICQPRTSCLECAGRTMSAWGTEIRFNVLFN